jgi:large subunit ribosomal protein L29
MNAKELRQKTAAELQKELLDLRREQFNLRLASGRSAKPDQFGKVRRNIARLKTVMAERRKGVAPTLAAEPAGKKASKAPATKRKTTARKTERKVKSA